VRVVGRKIGIGTAVALVCLAASGLPALAAAREVTLADGSTIRVWEQYRPPEPSGEAWWIEYSVTDSQGSVTTGFVRPTEDAELDYAPFLAVDETGSAVLVWSRFDGVYRKIAYARFSGNNWTNFHFLTFGPGHDDAPRIATGSTGSFLFYVRPDKYLYAGIELATGHLVAAPKSLNLGTARRDIVSPPQFTGGTLLRGGVDAPIAGITARAGSRIDTGPQGKRGRPGRLTPKGGTDVPVVTGIRAAAWGVGSNIDCAQIILVIPSRDLRSVYVFRFVNGTSDLLQRLDMPSPVDDRYGATTAESYLPQVCG
jgi:hypothetical protein